MSATVVFKVFSPIASRKVNTALAWSTVVANLTSGPAGTTSRSEDLRSASSGDSSDELKETPSLAVAESSLENKKIQLNNKKREKKKKERK